MKSGKLSMHGNIEMGQKNIIEIGANERSAEAGVYKKASGTTTVSFNSSMTRADMQALIDAQPKFIPRGTTLWFDFADGTYTLNSRLYINDFHGGGTLYIGNNGGLNTLHTSQTVNITSSAGSYMFYITGCTCTVWVRSLKFTLGATIITAVVGYNSSYVYVWGCYFIGISRAGTGVDADNAVYLASNSCYYDNLNVAMNSGVASTLRQQGSTHINTTPNYGLRATGGIITKATGSSITGFIADENISQGGVIRP